VPNQLVGQMLIAVDFDTVWRMGSVKNSHIEILQMFDPN
jgi:hypothetical protein